MQECWWSEKRAEILNVFTGCKTKTTAAFNLKKKKKKEKSDFLKIVLNDFNETGLPHKY